MWRRTVPPCRRASPRGRRRPRSRPSRHGARRSPVPCRRTRRAGGTRRPAYRRPSPAASTSAPSAPLVWTIACPLYIRISRASGSIASSGTARMISSTSSTSAWASANPRAPSTLPVNRARRPESRLATAWIGQPARLRAIPSAVPTAPAPTMPVDGVSPGPARRCGWVCPSAWTSPSSWRWWPGGTGSRSMPAAAMAASVSARSRSGSSPGSRPHGFIGMRRRRPGAERGTLACIESSEPAETDALSRIDPFGARAPLAPGFPDVYRLQRHRRPRRPRPACR